MQKRLASFDILKREEEFSMPKKSYDEMTDLEKVQHHERIQRAEKVQKVGGSMQKAGGAMMGIGCLMTLFITIPIILIVLFLL